MTETWRVPAGVWHGGRGDGAAAKAREKEERKENVKAGGTGPGRILGGPRVSKSCVYVVRTPAKLPHISFRFAGENTSALLHGPIQNRVGWFPRSGQRDPKRVNSGLRVRLEDALTHDTLVHPLTNILGQDTKGSA